MRSFIGFCTCFRRFIPDFTSLLEPLYKQTSAKIKQLNFDTQCLRSFELIKEKIKNSLPLKLPNFSKQFILHTDESNTNIDGVLLQDNEEKILEPIFYISRKLSRHEINYTITENECLSIIW